MSPTPKILFHGTGAIGTIYAYQLIKAGCDVTAICRSNYTAAKQSGFHINSDLYGKNLHIKPKVVRTPEEAAQDGPYDYLLVSCKALPEAKTAETIAPAVTPGRTTIVLVQNGIDIEQEYAERFPENPLLSCVVYLPATQTSPGHVSMGGIERLEIGAFPASARGNSTVKTSIDRLIEILKAGGGNPVYHEDIQELRWYKLLLNAPWNPICALTLSRDLAFLGSSAAAEHVINGVLDEVIAVSQALGYKSVTREAADQGLATIKGRKGTTPGIEPSMLVDVLWTRRTEHEVILGNPVRIAQKLGVPVLRMEMLYAMVKALDLAHQKRKEGKSLDDEDLADMYADIEY